MGHIRAKAAARPMEWYYAQRLRTRRFCASLFVLILTAGCGLPATGERSNIQSPDPDRRIEAIRAAVDANDRSAIPLIVDRLEDEDAGVRFFAILALERMTGERFGYDYGQPAWERAKSVEQWRAYVRRDIGSNESSLAADVVSNPAAVSETTK